MVSTPKPRSSFFALQVVLLCVAGPTAWAQKSASSWKTVSASDPAVTWTPPIKFCVPLLPQCGTNWYKLEHYIVSQAPSPNSVTLQFNGTTVEVYGGAIHTQGEGTTTMDGQQEQIIKFPGTAKSQLLTSFPKLDPNSPHTLVISFANSSRTLLGFDYFRIQESPPPTPMQSQHSAQPHPPAQSTKGSEPTTGSATGRRVHTIANTPSYPPGNPSPGNADPGASGTGSENSIIVVGSGTLTPYPSPEIPTASSSSTSGQHGPRPWEIAILVLGILALILSATVGFFLWRRRHTATRAGGVAGEKLPPVEVASQPGTPTPENPGPTPPASTGYAFTRPGSSVSTSRPTQWRNSRIGVSPYTYERAVPYPESTTERSSWIDPMPIPTPARRSITTVPEVVPTRHISFSGKGRILKVQNPETRSTTSVTETDTAH